MEASLERTAESHYVEMETWGPSVDDADTSAAHYDEQLASRLEHEMTLWHEDNGWSAAMPERARQDLIASIRSELDREQR
ncbi:hypothetical protein GCM10007298_34230 [Williamsia phyllosphaerae]|uniref:Uncharacterized protein n=2 Tax=Williamsia phyllosphaerae TaxID=885042 RepID=A0ABQ1V2Q3_9NOCA|nr:hypothetical protein GCM10007298_34230 [Williamsia phyllosphaerae]